MGASVVRGSTSEIAPTNVVFPTPNPPAITNLTAVTWLLERFLREHGHVLSSSLGRTVRSRTGSVWWIRMAPTSSRSPTRTVTTWLGRCIYADSSAIEMGRADSESSVRCSVVLPNLARSASASTRVSQRRPGRLVLVRPPVNYERADEPQGFGRAFGAHRVRGSVLLAQDLGAQLGDEHRGKERADLLQQEVGLVTDEANVAAGVGDDAQVAAVRDGRDE